MSLNNTVMTAPSILSADFADLAQEIRKIQDSGADLIHMDVMDGRFVPSITFGHKLVADLRRHTQLPFDVHLMIESPQDQLEAFAKAGAQYLTFHWEAAVHHHRIIEGIRSLGMKPGLSIVPSTPVEVLSQVLPFLDQVLVMSVNPGWGGQKFLEFTMDKVRWLDAWRRENQGKFLISVDGGVNTSTFMKVRDAGADILVTGSAFFESPDPRGFLAAMKA